MSDICFRNPPVLLALGAMTVFGPGQSAASDWVQFSNETATRLSADAALAVADVDEKDYAVGDVDLDGDDDLVVVRKEVFTSPGKRRNVLFLNEDGVLVDRTTEFASLSDVPGDQGFLTPTNDRDVKLVDVDGDGWLDIITAVTISDDDPKHLGHPRVYRNLGNAMDTGVWLGFKYEDARIPQMDSYTGVPNLNPRFCSMAVGDLTGDGYPDLWFGDYDSGAICGCEQPVGTDYNDRLLINQGDDGIPGYFDDLTQLYLLGDIQVSGFGDQPFEVSNFGTAAAIADMNGDGALDIVKTTSLQAPYYMGIAYNSPDSSGFFDLYEHISGAASDAYFFSIGDLNNDDKNDIVVSNDSIDRFLLNIGTGADGRADFAVHFFPASTNDFGGNSIIADLDNDGWNDVIIADVDVDIPGCTRVSDVLRNNADPPTISFSADSGNIPNSFLAGVHDVVALDINLDGWLDLVIGRCASTEVWINVPPVGVNFSYPQTLPEFISPNQTTSITTQLAPQGGIIDPASVTLHTSINGGTFSGTLMNAVGEDVYEGSFPAVQCSDEIAYYVSAQLDNGSGSTDPPDAPANTFLTTAVDNLLVTIDDSIEGGTASWTIVSDPSLTAGSWEPAVPNGTLQNGDLAAPNADATPAGTMAFVTENGPPNGQASDNDVDHGPTTLISPVIDMQGFDGVVSYARWLYNSFGDPDVLEVEVTANGTDWVLVETVAGTSSSWVTAAFRVGEFVEPSNQVQVRFTVCDCPNDSVTEAGLDDFRVTLLECTTPSCPGDLDGSDAVDAADLAMLLGAWGPNPGHVADVNNDNQVNATDLALVLGTWGPCPV